MNHSESQIFDQPTATTQRNREQTLSQRPNFIGVIGLVAVVVAYVPQLDFFTSGWLWVIGILAGVIGIFRPRRLWGILAICGGILPMFVVYVWVGYNLEQLKADGYFGEVPTKAIVQSEEVDATYSEPVEPAKHWIEIKSPRGGYVEIYIGMPSEEVKNLLGRPKSVDVNTFAGDVREEWRYDLPGYSWMTIDFENGKLERINQY